METNRENTAKEQFIARRIAIEFSAVLKFINSSQRTAQKFDNFMALP